MAVVMPGAMSVISAPTFSPRLTDPDVVAAVTGLVALTLAMVPGNACPGAKPMIPSLFTEKRVVVLDPSRYCM